MAERTRPSLTSRTVWIALLNALGLVIALVLVWRVRDVLGIVLVSILLAFALDAPVRWLVARRAPRGLAVALVFAAAVGIVVGVIATIVPVVVEQVSQLVDQGPALLDRLESSSPVRWAQRELDLGDRLRDAVQARAGEATGLAIDAATAVAGGVFAIGTTLILTLMMLLFGGRLFDGAVELVHPDHRPRWREVGQQIREVVGWYVLGLLVVSTFGGLVIGFTLWVLDVPYFLPLGLAMVVLGLIPYLGTIVGGALGTVLTLAYVGWPSTVVFLIVYVVYQQLEGDFLQPLVQRRVIKMNPLVVLVALLVGVASAGIIGALLAVPLAAAAQVVLADVQARREARWDAERTVRVIAG